MLSLMAIVFFVQSAPAQSDDENDPVKLFEKGQDAHARNDYKRAIELYDAAIKLKPEFPEAELQRAMALLSSNRKPEAIEGFKRTVTLRPDWALAYAKFGTVLATYGDSLADAEPVLREAVKLDPTSLEATVALALVRQGAHDYKEALSLIRAATALKDATAMTWQYRSDIENYAGESAAALSSITHALQIEPQNPRLLFYRARLFLGMKNSASALADLDAVRALLKPSKEQLSGIMSVAMLYDRAGKPEEGLKMIDALDEKLRNQPAVVELRADLAAAAGKVGPEDLAALEQVAQRDPGNASLLARLGASYRRVDPAKSQDYYYRALQLEPKNPKYAVGYAAALIQQRKFAEAEPILRRVIAATPNDIFTAHANLALALYEMKRFAEAVPEYEWLAAEKPEIAATYFFLATAHDNLGEYQKALDAYESFLSHADPVNNKLEIDKVNLRLPPLRAQIQRGEGVKPKRP